MAEINMLRSENERFAIKIQQDGVNYKEREKKLAIEIKTQQEKITSGIFCFIEKNINISRLKILHSSIIYIKKIKKINVNREKNKFKVK
jgi:hypothetical protein